MSDEDVLVEVAPVEAEAGPVQLRDALERLGIALLVLARSCPEGLLIGSTEQTGPTAVSRETVTP